MTTDPLRPVVDHYDALLIDLDGVVYRGDQAVAGAADALRAVRNRGVALQFITNNSARTPEQVVEKLAAAGVESRPEEILTSGIATAAMLRREGLDGTDAFVIGERGVREALEGAGIRIVDDEVDRVGLVVVGWDRSVDYPKLRRAALLVQRGARLVATNADATYPAPDGLWPGAGSILAAVTTATGATPVIVGKPARPLFEAAADRTRAANPLVVGDRLDTDVAGAVAMGWDSLLVTTGAHGPSDLLDASALPTYLGRDLFMLLERVPPARFRRAGRSDVDQLAELLEVSGLTGDGLENRILDTVIGEDDTGWILATACLQALGDDGLLRSVAVQEPVRGRGLGLLAVSATVPLARSAAVRRIWLFTETAEHFFAGLGFHRVDRGDLPTEVAESSQAQDDCRETAAVMVLEI